MPFKTLIACAALITGAPVLATPAGADLSAMVAGGLELVQVDSRAPEPESWTLMIIGVALVGGSMRLRRPAL